MNKIIGLVITALVSVIVLAAVLIPTINDATTTEDTFTNTGVFNYAVLDATDTYTFVFDHNVQDGTVTVNGDTVNVPVLVSGTAYSFSVVYDDDWLIRMSYSVNQGGYYCQIVGEDSGGNFVRYGGSIDATIENNLFKVAIDSDYDGTVDYTKTFNINTIYAIVADPDDAVLKVSNQSVYIKGDTELSMSGLTPIPNWYDIIHIEGSYDDGVTITSPSVPTATFSNIEWNIEPVTDHIDLYKLTSIEFDVTYSGTTVHATYSYFGVPSEVTAERSQHLSPAEIEILDILPVFIIIAVLIAAVAVVAFRRE